MSDLNRIGARIDRELVEVALGYLPEVGEAFAIEGLTLRVMARTVGVEPADDGRDVWFDELFVASVEAVEDLEEAGRALRAAFAADDDAPSGALAQAAPADGTPPSPAPLDLDEAIKREIEDILKAA